MVSDELCTYSTSKNGSIADVLKIADRFDCSERKYAVSGPRVWVKIPFMDSEIKDGAVEIQGDSSGLSSMSVHAVLDDGSIRSASFSEREVTRSWRPKGNFGLAVPGSEDPQIRRKIQEIYVSMDNPKIASSILFMQLASKETSDNLKLPLSVMFAALCGMAIIPLFYNIFFYAALRHSFLLWHSLTIAGSVIYTFSSSGLIFIAFADASMTTKFFLNYWSLTIAIAASGFFLVRFVEPGKIAKWLESVILISAVFPVFVTALALRFDGGYNLEGRIYFHSAFLPYFFVVIYSMFHAWQRGSKAIWFQIIAWTPILCLTLDRILRGMDVYVGILSLDYALYFVLIIETIVLAFGVAHRIMQLRLKHEATLRKQIELTRLAETDGLTAIGNRRAFENAYELNRTERKYKHLAILDIDFFKRINDRYGHEVGDDVLRIVGSELSKTRHFTARIGGEEFALLVASDGRENRKAPPSAELTRICENLIRAVHCQMPIIKEPVTFSVGIAAIEKQSSLRSVMAVADRRLYEAKNNGRNQVISFELPQLQSGGSPLNDRLDVASG
ncbi:diguanylate cyclase [Parasphingorhabdus sp.]|uniref:sensor domain-containing diguanylate cyclase n=1 Tax=Parasphingorhabdus sp. TaxID=2709688 RepID=UPI002F94C8EE